MAPVGGNMLGRGPYVKVTVHLLLEEKYGSWILTKGPGIQSRSYGTCGPHGGPGRGLLRAKTMQILK